MTKTIFLFSGEGTSSRETSYSLISTSPEWTRCEAILESSFDLNLNGIWETHIGTHACPYSPLLTAIAEICLSDLWMRWGYHPDLTIGHSTGELAAAYRAGLYSLETVLDLAMTIGRVASHREGIMMHGVVDPKTIPELPVYVSSQNFRVPDGIHVTISGYFDDIQAFAQTHPGFTEMKPRHPWHYPDYESYGASLDHVECEKAAALDYVSGITGGFETRLPSDYWASWLTRPVDFIKAMDAVRDRYDGENVTFIEIGFHPVLDRCCTEFENHTYVSSMFRGEEDIPWIMNQRRKLDQDPLTDTLRDALKGFEPELDFETSLAYQGLTSIRFVDLSVRLQRHFPSLAPQDFYRYKTIRKLMDGFGVKREESAYTRRSRDKHEVVICGMSCRFPSSSEHPLQFWDTLIRKQDQVGKIPDRGETVAGFLAGDNARFDHTYFNISPAEAKTMDPQQILALELTELLLKDAGLDLEALDRKRIGVYVGVWNQEYGGDTGSVFYPTGTNPSIIASRISYQYDLRGPSWVTNTACSSSLVAIHYAAKDIEEGRVDYAIAGGVNMLLGDGFSGIMGHAGFLSPNNRCKTFDNSADGYVRSEGGGFLLLANKNLVDAYYAEVIGSAVNQNGGRSQVITAPHPEAQEELILDACDDAGIAPQDMAYVECHGTGTKIGDPIEITALQNTVAKNRTTPCLLGSVKSNIGHLESAAGIAGILKSVLSLYHGKIPPNLHFDTPNQFIDFDSHKLKVVAEETGIDKDAVMGISSFGFGGANAHIILRGVDDSLRKELRPFDSPFDKQRATSVLEYTGKSFQKASAKTDPGKADAGVGRDHVADTVKGLFKELTGFDEIDPEVELTEQGLNSLSFTEMISQLEVLYDISIEPDVIFDFPFYDQLVDHILTLAKESTVGGEGGSAAPGRSVGRDQVADTVKSLFKELTGFDGIDPEVELTEQGLNSLSFTEMISQLEVLYDISIEPDVIFDYPFYDQLVDHILTLAKGKTGN